MRATFGGKLALARAAGAVSRRTGRGGGTTLPGRLLLSMDPRALERLGDRLPGGSTVISATNGKTTTAGMLASILRAAGRDPVHNRAGSNMHWGVATALVEQRGSEGLFEVDEAWLPRVVEALDARLVVLGNLFRDQLDRYGELETTAESWGRLLADRSHSTGFVLCADDPMVAELGRESASGDPREGVSYFGIEDRTAALPELQHAHDAKFSRRTGTAFSYQHAFVGHLGIYSAVGDPAARPTPEVAATRVGLRGLEGTDLEISTPDGTIELFLPLPGLYNVYNALAAVAAGLRMGVGLEAAREGIQTTRAVFGRVERIAMNDRELVILLVKNPAGANEVLRTLALEAGTEGVDLWVALNDRIADGRDVSWIWDADFELLEGRVRTVTCAGTRAPELALRMKHAGWPRELIHVHEDVAASLDSALARSGPRLFALPTYTALLELRDELANRGLAGEYWS